MKKIISFLLAGTILLSALNIFCLIPVKAGNSSAMNVGDKDSIIINDSPTYAQGSADNVNLCVVANGSFSSVAEVNTAVTASKVFTTWRWFSSSSSFYANIQPGQYVYAPNVYQNGQVPEITYKVSENAVLKFKLGLRENTAEWSDFKIQYSADGNTYTDVNSDDMAFTTLSYEADSSYYDGENKGQKHTVYVRSYDVNTYAGGYIKISLPKAEILQNNIVDNLLNSSGNSLTGSSAFLIPATLEGIISDRLAVGDRDTITVDTNGTKLSSDAGKVAYSKTAVNSLAILNDAICVTKVDTNWRWLDASSGFYTDVAAKDTWLYSVNPYYATTNGQIIYKVTGSTKVSFNIIIRDKTADWTDVSLTYSTDGSQFEVISSNNVNYSEMEYAANISTMRVRSYQIYIPSNDGYLAINLPNAESVMTGTIENNLNSARESIVYSSVMVTPAICGATSFVLEPGKKDSITLSDDATYIKGSANDTSIAVIGSSDIEAQYAKLNGIVATKVFSTWRWFKSSSSFYTDVIPASTADKSSWLYAVDIAFTGASPNIVYKVTENSVVKFKIGLRTDTAKWSDITIKFSDDGSTYSDLGDAVKFTEESYVAEDCRYYGGDKSGAFHEVIVREYAVDITKSGMLCIFFPQGSNIKENITANYLNTSGDSLVYSSVFMTPAECIKAESITGVFVKSGQEIVSILDDTITITSDITYGELDKYLILKNVTAEFYDKSGNKITDNNKVITTGAKIELFDLNGAPFKEYKFNRVYLEKSILGIDHKDSITISDDATYIKGSANDISIAVIGSSDIEAQYAKLNGIVATKVFSTWRWFKSSSSFYTDVIPASTADKSSWLYAVDLAFTGASPNIVYKVTENSVVKFKIGLRTDTANWSDITIKFSDDGSTYNDLGDAVKFTEESYVAEDCRYYGGDKSGAFHEVIVREYTVDIAESGMLCISFPQGNSIKENITANYLNTSGDSLVYSSVFMTPAECIKAESIKGVFAKDGQEIVSISSDAISITADITYEELSKHLILKNVVTEYYDKSGNEIADMKTVAASGAKVKVLNSDGTIFKEYKIKRIYIEKRTLKIGQQDTVNWENTPHYYNDSGTLVSTSEYLDADTLEYAKISGSILIKNTNSWVFSPFFTVSLWEKPHPIVYAMGYRAHGKEPPSIAWHVQSRAEIQIPISLPADCEEFFSDFKFMFSSDGTNWTDVPSYLIDYKSITRNYNTWGEATLRTYSVQIINSCWVKVVYPEWDKMSEEIKKINSGISFIESAACIVPPRVVQSSKDSSVSAGDGEIVVNVDNDKKHISLMCLIEDNLTVDDLISALTLKYCYCKAFDSNVNPLSGSSPVLEDMKLSFYARGNIFEEDDTHLFDYTVSVTKVKEFYKPKLTSKDASVVIDDANCSISVSYKVTNSINYEQLLNLIEFSHCTYKLVTVGDTEYTNTSNSVGADPVYILIYTKDCPGIEDGTLYDTYEIFGEILGSERIFVSRDTSKIYIDETEKIIYFANDMTIDEFCDGVIIINTTLEFYKMNNGLEELVTNYGTALDESFTLSSTVGSTVLYYELKPMTTVITPASVQHIKTRHAKIIPGYDSDMKYIIPGAIGIGVLLICISVAVILIVRKKKRKGGEK